MALVCTAMTGLAQLQLQNHKPSYANCFNWKDAAAPYARQQCDMARRRQTLTSASSVGSSSSAGSSSGGAAISVRSVDLTFTGRGISKKASGAWHQPGGMHAAPWRFWLPMLSPPARPNLPGAWRCPTFSLPVVPDRCWIA